MSAEEVPFARALSLAVHEFRTPVTVVAGYLRMLLREQAGAITEKQRKMLEEAERSCGRLRALVDEMSDLGKLESGALTLTRHDLDLSELLTELASHMHEGLDRGVRLEVRGASRPAMINGDRARLSAALRALLHSALRERGEAGAVVAACSVVDESAAASALVTIGDSSVLPSLAAARHQPPAFNEWLGGMGFALPLARRIIEAHGGALWSADGSQSKAASALKLPLSV
jgi:signal transduction histidine kinase